MSHADLFRRATVQGRGRRRLQEFGRAVYRRRVARGISRHALEALIPLSVRRLESGALCSWPTAPALRRLLDVLA